MGTELLGQPLGPLATFRVVGKSPEREQREVLLRDDIRAVPRPPELGERGVVQRRRLHAVEARVEGEERRARHAVLQAGPRGPSKRIRSQRNALLEPADSTPEREDLPPSEPESPLQGS